MCAARCKTPADGRLPVREPLSKHEEIMHTGGKDSDSIAQIKHPPNADQNARCEFYYQDAPCRPKLAQTNEDEAVAQTLKQERKKCDRLVQRGEISRPCFDVVSLDSMGLSGPPLSGTRGRSL